MTKKIKISTDQEAQRTHLAQSYSKLKLLNSAIDFFQSQTNEAPENLLNFEKSFYDYAIEFVKAKHPAGGNLGLTDILYCKMYGYDFEPLKDAENKYKAHTGAIKLTEGIFEADEDAIDFNIYASSERELKKLKDCEELIEKLTYFHQKYSPNSRINQTNYIGTFLIMDETGLKLIANPYFIKN